MILYQTAQLLEFTLRLLKVRQQSFALSKMPAKSGKTGGKGKTPKAPKAPKAKGGKRGRRKAVRSWSLYIFKVLKQVHSDTGISNKAMAIMNSFINDIFDRLATEAGILFVLCYSCCS